MYKFVYTEIENCSLCLFQLRLTYFKIFLFIFILFLRFLQLISRRVSLLYSKKIKLIFKKLKQKFVTREALTGSLLFSPQRRM